MSEQGADNLNLNSIFEQLVEVLRDLRMVVDPVGPMRPLSLDEAARVLRCRRDEVLTLINHGAIPFINRNGRRYLLPSDINNWLRKESIRETPRKKNSPATANAKPENIDPALLEFFD